MTDERINAVIVDDEPLARERLRRLLANESDIAVTGEVTNGSDAVAKIIELKPQLVFLDVQMPGLDGFEVVSQLVKSIGADEMPAIVFVTAYDSYAIRAFDARALDYLVKPFDDDRFHETLDRVRRQIHQGRIGSLASRLRDLLVAGQAQAPSEETASIESSAGRLDRIVLKTGTRARIIRAEEVDWIAADGVYARLHFDGSSALIRTPLNELEVRLDGARFVRVHRSAIVNLDRVRELREFERGEYYLILNDGTRVRLSRSRRAHLESMLGQRL